MYSHVNDTRLIPVSWIWRLAVHGAILNRDLGLVNEKSRKKRKVQSVYVAPDVKPIRHSVSPKAFTPEEDEHLIDYLAMHIPIKKTWRS